MLRKAARNDVVRLTESGEVGTVRGWADHATINGTVLDIQFSRTDVRTLGAEKLEFVASAKAAQTTARKVWGWLSLILSAAGGSWIGWNLRGYGVPIDIAVIQGFITAWLWLVMFGLWSRPRKTRMTQPVQFVTAKPKGRVQGRPAQSRPKF